MSTKLLQGSFLPFYKEFLLINQRLRWNSGRNLPGKKLIVIESDVIIFPSAAGRCFERFQHARIAIFSDYRDPMPLLT